ncbi:MAG TPA: rRNA maturation RNase YbeY [Bacteroidales bacterium]|nr:rRNA maturation RNase YbeY [Bacteroidales bacterium]
MSINIFYDEIGYRYIGWRRLRKILVEIILHSGFIPGDINVVITDDTRLLKINVEFLEHDYNTDVITFNYNLDKNINGEIYISLDTVKENSIKYGENLKSEISRVIIHGVLHLTGLNDKSDEERIIMRMQEDYWLKILFEKDYGI